MDVGRGPDSLKEREMAREIKITGTGPEADRRRFIAGAAGLLGAGWFGPALAQSGTVGGQAEWAQSYDAGGQKTRNIITAHPILSQATVQATEGAIRVYQEIVARGGHTPLPSNQRLTLGTRHANVQELRQRLIELGDLSSNAGNSNVFDSYVDQAVKRYQARHGLTPTGTVGAQTFAALNTSAQIRLKQLEVNLVRLRSYSGNLGSRHVTTNIPAAYIETVENGTVATRHVAGVGKVDRQSPIMNAKILDVNFNPFWTVPASIIKKDLIPLMRKNPNYLTEQKIRIINRQGQEIPPAQVNWSTEEATQYMFRQDPGGEYNSLGFVRINIANPHGVYMHDTPAKGIFGDDYRFVSSGCVRVQNVRDYIYWILQDNPQWTRDAIDTALRSGQRIDARPREPIPVYWVYITAWGTPEGIIQFRDDIYGRDGVGPGALTEALREGDDRPE
ncbi:MAG: L,D-transpeptidase family protein [Proteobacteria bacterium]|nr:L,D-transpeptidase family protein [Pseudomonadota bacterium]